MHTYFKKWIQYLEINELNKVLSILEQEYKTKKISPSKGEVFKVFNLCEYDNLKVIMIGQDPYPQPGIATGIMFGNNVENLSPSLQVIKDALLDPRKPRYDSYYFDYTLESWVRQGVLMLNSALTVEVNKVGSHTMLWRKFISSFIEKVSNANNVMIFVLLGAQAKTFKPYINKNCHIIEENHPAYYARINKPMPDTIFRKINSILKDSNNFKIKWYEEIDARK